jgi:threonine aldolase
MATAGVLANALGSSRVRFVTHRGLTEADIESAVKIIKSLASRLLVAA